MVSTLDNSYITTKCIISVLKKGCFYSFCVSIKCPIMFMSIIVGTAFLFIKLSCRKKKLTEENRRLDLEISGSDPIIVY